MMRSLWTAATGMTAQQLNIDVIANNLSNVNTNGFKRSRVDFQDLLYQNLRLAGASSSIDSQIPTGIQVGLGSRPVAVSKLLHQGDYQMTGNPLDVSIEGNGFFQVIMPNGEVAYTRAGAFKLNSQGNMVTSDGYMLEPAIALPGSSVDISIGTDGTVTVRQDGQTAATSVGNITLAKFPNPSGLQSIGRCLFLPTDASGDATTGTPGTEGFGTLTQGALEMSNVNIVEEMVNMIVAQRAYEINSKSVQVADDMLQIANNLKR
ncbi:MAG: flagellar basal-body rod protein FlgG [Deltaproteobacteria bacterium]|nr:flagellar basal-body rod protein FlgG [Deltaproteobacteria bacterium]MBW2306803.1 flagellar basal-body rod protein FlgG [Deltaproteobacteria bacterium]